MNMKPGAYSCPMVWETRFNVHPRLIETRGSHVTSKGLLAVQYALDIFMVHNRANMFVYREENGETYYMKVGSWASLASFANFALFNGGFSQRTK